MLITGKINKRAINIKTYSNLSNAEIFSKTYKNKLWDLNSKIEYSSGPGSHDKEIVDPYVNQIVKFFKKNNNLIVVDLGCSDFNIGSKIFKYSKNYIAIDVVNGLIDYNKKNYVSRNLKFKTIDAVYDEIPSGETAFSLRRFSNTLQIANKINFK